MGLKTTFDNGVKTAFKVFKEAVKSANCVVVIDNGFDEKSESLSPTRVILDKFSQDDKDALTFTDLIQSTDTKGLVPGKELTVDISTVKILDVEGRRFNIVAFETDPYGALYTLLLRDVR